MARCGSPTSAKAPPAPGGDRAGPRASRFRPLEMRERGDRIAGANQRLAEAGEDERIVGRDIARPSVKPERGILVPHRERGFAGGEQRVQILRIARQPRQRVSQVARLGRRDRLDDGTRDVLRRNGHRRDRDK